uniref:Large ribosomal subunit protein uL22c n=1 Tax=Euglena clara TaxID=215708 RepID=A0A2Z4YV02_9EUGL|nr:ribosomal protein L22 [Euglena clara]AXA45494.1 ribosomal protein L22 [Euglena clara]
MNYTRKLESKAFVGYIRISPSKVRRILDQIRNVSCEEAFIILKFMPYKACPIISKVLYSAVSNAKQQFGAKSHSLYIIEARADDGPVLKRFCPHAQGRGFPIKKRMSHITSTI